MNGLSAIALANAILVCPGTISGTAVSALDVSQRNHLLITTADTGRSVDLNLDPTLFSRANILVRGTTGDADTSSPINSTLARIRYRPAIDRVMEASNFGEAVSEFLSSATAGAIADLSAELLPPSLEEKRWEFLERLGEGGTPNNLDARFQRLLVALASGDAGDRSAAASAIGAIGHPLARAALAASLPNENNLIVKAVLEAKLRVIGRNGSTIKTAA
jgi:hypothetical protein